MTNGVLLSNGCDALIVPAKYRQNYNPETLELYNIKNATPAVFLRECYRTLDTNLDLDDKQS